MNDFVGLLILIVFLMGGAFAIGFSAAEDMAVEPAIGTNTLDGLPHVRHTVVEFANSRGHWCTALVVGQGTGLSCVESSGGDDR